MTRKILVTGGAGYIGSHVCKALAGIGWEPVTYDNLVSGNTWAVKWGPLIRGDINDRHALTAVLETHRPEAVMHLAALSSVAESMREPEHYFSVNVHGTLELLAAMRDAGVPHIVFSSTASVYGAPQEVPIPEMHPLDPVNPYGKSKLMAERLLSDFARRHGITSVALRYFNAAGADPDGELGECRRAETHLIPIAVEVARGRRPMLQIFGRDYRTRDGTCVRDYIHVSDIADAHILALDYLREGGEPTALNLGTNTGASVLEVVEALRLVSGKSIPTEDCPRRPGDPEELVSDSSAAREILDWRTEHSDLESILRSAWAWQSAM